MNQENIGKLIKEIRKKNGLTQEKFAIKYGVTYQAVSKWENGKNIPDITILKEICNDYNVDLNSLLNGNANINKKKKKKILFILIIFVIILISLCSLIIYNKDDNDFYFNTISTNCNDFNLFGSIAYNENKTSIYISNITYCGEIDKNEYIKIECSLYETNDSTKTKISSYSYSDEGTISLNDFLNKVNFNIDHYSKTCTMYKENSLVLEIEAVNINNQTLFYKIPLKLDDNCKE